MHDELYSQISQTEQASTNEMEEKSTDGMEDGVYSRTDLDSHANMPVVGSNSCIVSDHHTTVEVRPYSPDYAPLNIPLVDAAVMYDCPHSGQSHVLIVRNALYVQSMVNNLLPPFVLREKGIICNDTAKIHVQDPGVDDHAIVFPETGLRIPLQLHGIFSYFATRQPTTTELMESDSIYLLTPSRFNPHDTAYSANEASMLDWKGEMIEARHRNRIMLSDVPDHQDFSKNLKISDVEQQIVSNVFEVEEEQSSEDAMLASVGMLSEAGTVQPCLDDTVFLSRLTERLESAGFRMSIGSTDMTEDEFLEYEEQPEQPLEERMEGVELPGRDHDDFDETVDVIMGLGAKGQLNFDDIFVSATTASNKYRGADAAHLSKIWRIDHEMAEATLEITSQRNRRKDNPKLSRNYGTGDRMLCYRHLNTYFFMDTFFATSKGGKSSRGHNCCQLFVTDKGFVYVVPMKSKSEVLQAVKQFAKEIGAPDAIVCDAAGEQKSGELRKFLNEIGTSLRLLEENTPWANKAELYIGLIKEAVRKDMMSSNCPLAFWDYCVERRARINNMTPKRIFKLHGTNPHTALLGEEGDISNISEYGFYDWCVFREQGASFPFSKEVLGRVLGPANGEGNEMAQWILKSNGRVVPRRSHRPLTTEEVNSPTEKRKRDLFDTLIERRWGSPMSPPKKPVSTDSDDFEPYEDDERDP